MSLSFESFLENNKWKPLKLHLRELPNNLDQNISLAIKHENIKERRKWLSAKYNIKKGNLKEQKELKKELFSGNVVGVDGTCVDCDLIMGFQARIAIVAVNYKNNRTDYVTYISEPFVNYSAADIKEELEYIRKKAAGKVGITSAHVRAIMLYKERDFVLNRKEKFKLVHGDILPYELRTGQGRLRGLNKCLALGRKLLNENNIAGVQTTTARPQLVWAGRALEAGEYVELYDYFNELNAFLEGDDFRGPAHFNDEDKKAFRDFNEDVKNKFSVGMYKVKRRAYVFYAPKQNFDTMANLIFADSQYQSLRGVPLLLDYADIICSRLFAAGDFRKMIEKKLARQNKLEFEVSEKSLRRR